MKTLKTAILLVGSTLLFGCQYAQSNHNDYRNHDVPISYDYSDVSKYALSWYQIFSVETDEYYVYFYSTTCSHCLELKDFIVEKALKRGDIYFVKSSNSDQFTEDPNQSIGAENPGEIWILGYPTLLKIEDKICTKSLAGNDKIKNELK